MVGKAGEMYSAIFLTTSLESRGWRLGNSCGQSEEQKWRVWEVLIIFRLNFSPRGRKLVYHPQLRKLFKETWSNW
jgi:hypothetical protein